MASHLLQIPKAGYAKKGFFKNWPLDYINDQIAKKCCFNEAALGGLEAAKVDIRWTGHPDWVNVIVFYDNWGTLNYVPLFNECYNEESNTWVPNNHDSVDIMFSD